MNKTKQKQFLIFTAKTKKIDNFRFQKFPLFSLPSNFRAGSARASSPYAHVSNCRSHSSVRKVGDASMWFLAVFKNLSIDIGLLRVNGGAFNVSLSLTCLLLSSRGVYVQQKTQPRRGRTHPPFFSACWNTGNLPNVDFGSGHVRVAFPINKAEGKCFVFLNDHYYESNSDGIRYYFCIFVDFGWLRARG